MVAVQDMKLVFLDVTFEDMRQMLDVHISMAMATLDMEHLLQAYAMLEGVCQQYARNAVETLQASVAPLWHHLSLIHI